MLPRTAPLRLAGMTVPRAGITVVVVAVDFAIETADNTVNT